MTISIKKSSTAITGGRVFTVTQDVIEKGTVLIKDEKIVAVGRVEDLEVPGDAHVIDAQGMWITPGFIDAHCHIGCVVEFGPDAADGNETSDPITPHIRMYDAFNPHDVAIPLVRAAGFSSGCTLPGSSNLINGTGFAFKFKDADTVEDMALPGTECMKMALGENPVRTYGQGQKRAPATRMGNIGLLRQTLKRAVWYSDRLSEIDAGSQEEFTRDFKLEALVPVVRREMTARIHAHIPVDIAAAIRIAEEFELDYVLEHCTVGYKFAEYIASKGCPVVTDFYLLGPMKKEVYEQSSANPGLLAQAGCEISLSRDSGSGTFWLPSSIGFGIAHSNLKWETALKAVTINPARLLRLDKRLGSIEPGKDADISVWTGDPFSNYTLCKHTIIDGRVYDNSPIVKWQ